MSNSPDFIPIDLAGRVATALPPPVKTYKDTRCPSFHVMKLPALNQDVEQLRHLVVEYCIQASGGYSRHAIWWTSYVVLARPGTLTRGTGVYTEWSEFGTVSSQQDVGIISPRPSGIHIADISKGVLNSHVSGSNPSNGIVLRDVDLSRAPTNLEIFAVLVTTGVIDGEDKVQGQAMLEYRIRNNR